MTAWDAINRRPQFRDILRSVVLAQLSTDFRITSDHSLEAIDWPTALFCASALASEELTEAQDAVLRIAQACLSSTQAAETQKIASAVLLERSGNRLALALANQRGLVSTDAWENAPTALRLEVIRQRLDLCIPLETGELLHANQFQRHFWDSALSRSWVSVSAPTSAGKSHIAKQWVIDRIRSNSSYRCLYIVPTRALIDEVSNDFSALIGGEAQVITLPWDSTVGTAAHEIFVLTQERAHLLQERMPDFVPDLVFVDEAQKLGDGSRGILLQQVIDEAIRRGPSAQVIYAAPLAENPELLLEGAPAAVTGEVVDSFSPTVNQNLLWANQVPRHRRLWKLDVLRDSQPEPVGQFELSATPVNTSMRLPLVAFALAGHTPGNIVYANGAADAETAATLLYNALGAEAATDDPQIAALREMVGSTVHASYQLVQVLERGVAFHYGNMPQIIRQEIENLFREGKIRFLVCTSTLLEGVNLPCKNIFARGPRKGRGNKMTPADFWNLAGRAGRWGKEFEGNIVCVDTTDTNQWDDPPRGRSRQPMRRSISTVASEYGRLADYIDQRDPSNESRDWPLAEAVVSYLATRVARGMPIAYIPGLNNNDPGFTRVMENLARQLQSITVPPSIISMHAGVAPGAMQGLLDEFRSATNLDLLRLPHPTEPYSSNFYAQALGMCTNILGADFGNERRQRQLAVLLARWMSGVPVARLISDRYNFERSRTDIAVKKRKSLPVIIREILGDVENVARFQAPKYLSCYASLLNVAKSERGEAISGDEAFDISMLLELGVQRMTDVSLMSLGLSRSTTLLLGRLIPADDWSPEASLIWLRTLNIPGLGLPILAAAEVQKAIARNSSRLPGFSSPPSDLH